MIVNYVYCPTSLHKRCPKYHGHKRDLRATLENCGAAGERAQLILVGMKALGVRNASHP